MRQIFKAGHPVAWIGDSAPVPDGWHIDANKALEYEPRKEVIKNADEEKGQRRQEVLTPNLDAMSKDDLEAFAREQFGVDLDKRKRLEALRDQVSSLMGE